LFQRTPSPSHAFAHFSLPVFLIAAIFGFADSVKKESSLPSPFLAGGVAFHFFPLLLPRPRPNSIVLAFFYFLSDIFFILRELYPNFSLGLLDVRCPEFSRRVFFLDRSDSGPLSFPPARR